MAKLLQVEDLKTQFTTSGGVVRAVDGVSYDVEEGETVALVGESGCGKSVSALSVMRLVAEPAGRIVSGRLLFKGRDLLSLSNAEMAKVRGGEIGMVFQEPMTSLNPVLTIGEQIGEAIRLHQDLPESAVAAKAVEMLRRVHIPEPAQRRTMLPDTTQAPASGAVIPRQTMPSPSSPWSRPGIGPVPVTVFLRTWTAVAPALMMPRKLSRRSLSATRTAVEPPTAIPDFAGPR